MEHARRRARIATAVVTATLIVLIYVGSLGLKRSDSAPIGYCVASIFAFAAPTCFTCRARRPSVSPSA